MSLFLIHMYHLSLAEVLLKIAVIRASSYIWQLMARPFGYFGKSPTVIAAVVPRSRVDAGQLPITKASHFNINSFFFSGKTPIQIVTSNF